MLLGDSCFVAEPQLAQIIEQPAGLGLRLTSLQKWELSKKKPTSQVYWLELLVETGVIRKEDVEDLLVEANQLVAITVASVKTAKRNKSG